jgi:hypothetical protein
MEMIQQRVLRTASGLDRKPAAVGAVGGGFNLATGLDPGSIAPKISNHNCTQASCSSMAAGKTRRTAARSRSSTRRPESC